MCYKLRAAFPGRAFLHRLHTRTMRLFSKSCGCTNEISLFVLLEVWCFGRGTFCSQEGVRWIAGRLIWELCSQHSLWKVTSAQRNPEERQERMLWQEHGEPFPATDTKWGEDGFKTEWMNKSSSIPRGLVVRDGLVFPAGWAVPERAQCIIVWLPWVPCSPTTPHRQLPQIITQ